MKKVLALALAVLMLATVAFAAGSAERNVAPGGKIKFYRDSNTLRDKEDSHYYNVTINYDKPEYGMAKDLNTDNYSVTSIKYNEGKSLIESIKIDDVEEELVVKMKQDYTNTKAKSFDVEFTLKGKGKFKTDADKNVSVPDIDVRIKGTVGYMQVEVPLTDTDDDINLDDYALGSTLLKFDDQGAAYSTLNHDYEDGELTLEVRVYDGNKMFLNCDTDAVTSVLKANADSDAEMFFYDFEGTPTFDATAKLYFNDADEDSYVYQIKNGKLVKAGSYSEDDGCWVVKARTLGSYVVSDTKLASTSETTDAADENPDTGANDVVGIATAIAAVALVSAAAVSLKK